MKPVASLRAIFFLGVKLDMYLVHGLTLERYYLSVLFAFRCFSLEFICLVSRAFLT